MQVFKNFVRIDFKNGINLTGKIKSKNICDGQLALVSFSDCNVILGDRKLFDSNWGTFDLACGKSVVSVSGGPADMESYLSHMDLELPNKKIPEYFSL